MGIFNRKKTESAVSTTSNPKFIVLCLGLLIGFVAGFVLLLAQIPVNPGLVDYNSAGAKTTENPTPSYEFYKLLPGAVQQADAGADVGAIITATPAPQRPVFQPATRVVPANAQIVQAPAVTEVPATFNAQQSWFLQAGKFQQHEQAQTMRAQVLMLGLEAFIITREDADGSTAHRVRVGPYYDQNLLTEAKKRLRRGRISYEIVRVTG